MGFTLDKESFMRGLMTGLKLPRPGPDTLLPPEGTIYATADGRIRAVLVFMDKPQRNGGTSSFIYYSDMVLGIVDGESYSICGGYGACLLSRYENQYGGLGCYGMNVFGSKSCDRSTLVNGRWQISGGTSGRTGDGRFTPTGWANDWNLVPMSTIHPQYNDISTLAPVEFP